MPSANKRYAVVYIYHRHTYFQAWDFNRSMMIFFGGDHAFIELKCVPKYRGIYTTANKIEAKVLFKRLESSIESRDYESNFGVMIPYKDEGRFALIEI